MYDIIVIGAGPAGLTAALYARRANKTVLVLEKGAFGGQITYSPKVENYPGFESLSGNELADKMVDQVLAQGADVELETVTGIRDDGDRKTVLTESGEYQGRAVILATGVKHRMLGLPNETDFVGHGISFCAVCDGAFYRDKTVAVIGGGNSALQEAILLAENCRRIIMIQNLDDFTGEPKLVETLTAYPHVECRFGTVVTDLYGEEELAGIGIASTDGTTERLDIDGMFIAIGLEPENGAFADLAALDGQGYFDTDETCATGTPGVFVAGDCRAKSVRQITTAAADGAVAALAACKYLDM